MGMRYTTFQKQKAKLEREVRREYNVPPWHKTVFQFWEEAQQDDKKREVYATDFFPMVNYLRHHKNRYQRYTGRTEQPFQVRNANEKTKGVVKTERGYIQPLALYLSIYPKAMERTIQYNLQNRAGAIEKYGSVTYFEDLVASGAIKNPSAMSLQDGAYQRNMALFNEAIWEGWKLNYHLLKRAHLGVFLTKRQAEDWMSGNYVKEDKHFLYLKHYRAYRDFEDVIFADTDWEQGELLKISKALRYVAKEHRVNFGKKLLVPSDAKKKWIQYS